MRIQNFSLDLPIERQFFHRLLLDIERRDLPDCGFYTTMGSLHWNGQPVETLSCKLPEEGRELHAFIVKKPEDRDVGFVLMVVMMLNQKATWSQEWTIDPKRIGNLSFELVKKFLEQTGRIKTDRQGIELMYPAYNLRVPEVIVYPPNQFSEDKPKSYISSPLPDVAEEELPGDAPRIHPV